MRGLSGGQDVCQELQGVMGARPESVSEEGYIGFALPHFKGWRASLSYTCIVFLDEVFQLRSLLLCQLPKLHTTSLHGSAASWYAVDYFAGDRVGYLVVRHGFYRHLAEIKITFGQEYVQM